MKKEEFTQSHLLKICELYQEHLGGHSIKNYIKNDFGELESLLETIHKSGRVYGLRVGSRFDYHTKLGFKQNRKSLDVLPEVNLNFEINSRQGPKYESAIKAQESFLVAVKQYLSNECC